LDMKRVIIFGLILMLLALGVLTLAAGEENKPSVSVSTPFTGVEIEQGQSVSTSITVRNSLNQSLDLQLIVEKPEGWEVKTTYSGYNVFRIFLEPDSERRISVEINIPNNAKPGVSFVKFRAESVDGRFVSNEVVLEFRVLEKPREKPIELKVSFPSLSGRPGDTLEYRFDLKNNLDREITVSLEAVNVPEGWSVSFKPSPFESRVISSVSLSPRGRETNLVMEVKAPSITQPGEYKIKLVASAEEYTADTEITATITGVARYRLITPNQLLSFEVGAGEERQVSIILLNEGSEDLEDISVSVSAPTGWEAKIEPEKIGLVPAGDTATITLTIRPPGNALAGDYSVRVSTSSPEAGRENLQFRVTVTKQTFWGLVGVGVVAASVLALLFVFWRYGRP